MGELYTVLYNETNQPENLEVKPKKEVGYRPQRHRKVEKAIKEKRNKKAAVHDDVCVTY